MGDVLWRNWLDRRGSLDKCAKNSGHYLSTNITASAMRLKELSEIN